MKLKNLALACAAVSAICASGYALAATYWTDYAYYSDTTYTTQVGWANKDCKNRYTSGGTITSYRLVIEQYNCAYPIP